MESSRYTKYAGIFYTVIPKKKWWGLGLQAGYGYPGGWYVGAGVSCNLVMW